MIHDQSLQTFLWVEACRATVHIQNYSLHQVLNNMTPEEALTVFKPEISYFRTFGCPIYIFILKEKRSKFEPPRKKCIFVGYSDFSKATRIYIPSQK